MLLFGLFLGVAQAGGRALDREAFISDADTRLIATQVVDAFIDVLIDHRARSQKRFLYVVRGLCRCLKEDKVMLLGEALTLFGTDLAAGVKVALVAD